MAALNLLLLLERAMKLKILGCLSLIAFVVSLSPLARAQTFSVIHSFTDTGVDGANPEAGVTIRGNALYGTTANGGYGCVMGQQCGTVYQVIHVGSSWITTPVVLLGSGGGFNPEARVVFGPDNHLYGTNLIGVGNDGLVFNLIPPVGICKTFMSPPEGARNFGLPTRR